jgi:hypothetical protein
LLPEPAYEITLPGSRFRTKPVVVTLLVKEELGTFAVTPAIEDKNTCAGSGNEKNPNANATKVLTVVLIIRNNFFLIFYDYYYHLKNVKGQILLWIH